MNEEMKKFNPENTKGDLVIFKNPTVGTFIDLTPGGYKIKLKAMEEVIIPKSLAIWLIGNYESPFWKDGPGTAEEIKAIYSRNRYPSIFCRVMGPAPENSKPIIEETVENPEDKLRDLAIKPEKLVLDMSHIEKSNEDTDRVGGPNFTT